MWNEMLGDCGGRAKRKMKERREASGEKGVEMKELEKGETYAAEEKRKKETAKRKELGKER